MSTGLETLVERLDPPPRPLELAAGQVLLRQGERLGCLFLLRSGKVEILKNQAQICVVEERGAVFGELSLLLGCYQNATVRAQSPSTFWVVDNAGAVIEKFPELALELARLLARRLALLDARFAELKQQILRMQAESLGPSETAH